MTQMISLILYPCDMRKKVLFKYPFHSRPLPYLPVTGKAKVAESCEAKEGSSGFAGIPSEGILPTDKGPRLLGAGLTHRQVPRAV